MHDRANDATRVIVGRHVGRSLVQILETEGCLVRRGGANHSCLTWRRSFLPKIGRVFAASGAGFQPFPVLFSIIGFQECP
jgi:hypothetical protein